jgi:peptide/nickel transport system permease protein
MLRNGSGTAVALPATTDAVQRLRRLLGVVVSFAGRKPLGAAGGIIVVIMVVVAALASVIAPYPPKEVYVAHRYAPPGGICEDQNRCGENLGSRFWLGTDDLGRDTLSRLIYGARTSLIVAVVSVLIGVTAGALVGIVSAYFGGALDLVVQRLVDTLMSFPSIILALAVVAVAGASLRNVILALIVILIPGAARIIRSQALAIREMDYMLAGRALGTGNGRMIFRHMLPNCMAPFLVFATANLGFTIVVEAGLSFLGVGTPPDVPSWGGMLSVAGQKYVEVSPWLVVFPSIAVSLAVFGFNLLGDALRDVLDPRLRGAR